MIIACEIFADELLDPVIQLVSCHHVFAIKFVKFSVNVIAITLGE